MSTGWAIALGWLLGAGCMMLRDYYRDRAHRAALRAVREKAQANAEASRPRPKVLAVANWPLEVDREASSHAASRDRRGSNLET